MYTEVASTHHSHYDYINAVIENKIIFKSCFSFLQSNKKVFFLKIFTSKGKIDVSPTLDERFKIPPSPLYSV